MSCRLAKKGKLKWIKLLVGKCVVIKVTEITENGWIDFKIILHYTSVTEKLTKG